VTVDLRVTDADPAAMKLLGNAFCAAKLLLTATEVGVFSELERRPATGGELTEALGLHPRGVPDFLRALVAMGLLEEDGGRYRNSASASRLLVRGADGYVGGYLARADHMLYPAWGRFTEALRTGAPQAADGFAAMLTDQAKLQQFLNMMDTVNSRIVGDLLAALPWEDHASVADIGGARGNIAGRLAQAHPGLQGIVFDLAPIEPAANAHLASLGVADRVRFRAGDFFSDPMPSADVLIMGHVLHNWSPSERAMLVKKAYDAISPGGALLVYDAMMEPEPADLSKILVSLNMLLVTEGGSEYTAADCQAWMSEAGFHTVSAAPAASGDTIVVARK
jgi:2-polyprenyl-3-methyl-5-hydroxy-6-metoxy-1,4-benzoquinol methylase